MNAGQLFADIGTGCLTEVPAAASSYYCANRGLQARQSFYVYPDGGIVALESCDGGYQVNILGEEDAIIFSHLYLRA